MHQNSVISIQNLNHYFGKRLLRKQVLFDINLAVKPGEIVILTGPSGSGKTTLLSLIGGLRSVQQGSVRVLGCELCRATDKKLLQLRRQLGYIFQRHNLVPFLTACQNVQMSLELCQHISKQEVRSRSDAILEVVGLKHRKDYYPEQLSEGQKQRVAIARALVTQPRIVLADEPTASLDKNSGRDVVEILQQLAKHQGCSILLVTHDNRILDIADRLVNMEDGRLSKSAEIFPLNSRNTKTNQEFEFSRQTRDLSAENFTSLLAKVLSESQQSLQALEMLEDGHQELIENQLENVIQALTLLLKKSKLGRC